MYQFRSPIRGNMSRMTVATCFRVKSRTGKTLVFFSDIIKTSNSPCPPPLSNPLHSMAPHSIFETHPSNYCCLSLLSVTAKFIVSCLYSQSPLPHLPHSLQTTPAKLPAPYLYIISLIKMVNACCQPIVF